MILLAKYVLIGIALAFASYQDVKTREIDDKVWLIAGGIGAALTAYEILTTPSYPLLLAGISITVTTVLALGIFYLGLYGGADAKALIAIALTVPIALPPPANSVSPLFPLTVFGNSLLVSIVFIPFCAAWNLAWLARGRPLFSGIEASPLQKAAAFFIGVKVSAERAKSVHFNILERVRDDGGRHLKVFSRVSEYYEEEEQEVRRVIAAAERSGMKGNARGGGKNEAGAIGGDYVWATPAIPMIVFFLAGYALSFVLGDMLFGLIAYFMGVL